MGVKTPHPPTESATSPRRNGARCSLADLSRYSTRTAIPRGHLFHLAPLLRGEVGTTRLFRVRGLYTQHKQSPPPVVLADAVRGAAVTRRLVLDRPRGEFRALCQAQVEHAARDVHPGDLHPHPVPEAEPAPRPPS